MRFEEHDHDRDEFGDLAELGHTHSIRGGSRPSGALLAVLVPVLLLTIVGVIALWPNSERAESRAALDFGAELVDGTVERVETGECLATAPGSDLECQVAAVRLEEGPDRGDIFELEIQESPTSVTLRGGDKIVLNRVSAPDVPPDLRYTFADYQRSTPLVLLAVLFVVAVAALGRFQGIRSLVALAVSLFVLVRFVLPSILDGNNAIAVALVGAALIMLATLYLTHGYNEKTTTAVLGTFASLLLTGLLALLFVGLTNITGLADEDARILTVAAERIDVRGILLGGIIIGALGVLDDVTVTQVSAVWELRKANARMSARELYASALRIGRDHIASTVNTLVLAYAGASLPLLILLVQSERALGDVLTSETIASEIVQTLVGSIGLVASVPITTALAAAIVSRPSWAEANAAG
ncbi:MAG TPA: YibE/F family protein [Acidimicrobiales bacterium]|nr:YibE/F family protein [Acidimicrobiales bacterium]